MTDGFVVRRRIKKTHPMRRYRLGASLAGALPGGGTADFPGSEMPEPESGGRRWITGGVSAAAHAALIALLIYIASLVVVEEEEKIFELVLPKEVASEEEPAPAPIVIAEKWSDFAPQQMERAPQIVNPTIIQDLAQPILQQQIDMAVIAPTVAPTQVSVHAVQVDHVSQIASPVSATTARVVPNYQGKALRGPIQHVVPVGVVSGPRQVATGTKVGSAVSSLGSGSSVRDGIASNRDVFGAKQGVRANVQWNLGKMADRGQGIGGDGRGPGAMTLDECLALPAVQAYMVGVKDRVLSRWVLPLGAVTTSVVLRFQLDPAGSATSVDFQNSGDPAVGKSAVEAVMAASPFNHMKSGVRCLANIPLIATFKNPTVEPN